MKKNNKILTALLACAIALGLWFYVVTVVKPESTNTYYNIPVVLDGEHFLTERQLMIVGGENSTVTMELYGNRTDLDKVNSANITLIADLSKIYEPGEVELTYSHRFPGDVPSGALSIQSKSPGTIKLTVARREVKSVPVKITYVGETPDDQMYIVDKDNVVLDFPEITLTGPDTVLANIDHAAIVVDLTGKNETFKETYPITVCDKDGNGVNVERVTPNTTEVTLELPIRYMKEIVLDIDAVSGGGATKEISSIAFNPRTIKVSGNKSVLSKMTKLVIGSVNLGELTGPTTKTFPIDLPEGLINVTGVEEATVQISFPLLDTKELSVTATNIQVLNVPEDMSYEMLTQALKVTVRGPKNLVGRVNANDVTVTIDLADAVAGTATYKPVITVDEKRFPSVGVIGTYSVGVTLQADASAASETTPE